MKVVQCLVKKFNFKLRITFLVYELCQLETIEFLKFVFLFHSFMYPTVPTIPQFYVSHCTNLFNKA